MSDMNGGGVAVMGMSQEERDLAAAVLHNCGCTPPTSEAEAEGWHHRCAAGDLLRDDVAARLAALRREREGREWGER